MDLEFLNLEVQKNLNDGGKILENLKQEEMTDGNSYYKYILAEKICERKNRSAILIQSFFRGYQVRRNLKILWKSSIKIQSYIRGYLTRKKLAKESEARRIGQLLNEKATRIQAWWRGIQSRKKIFDWANYNKILSKNLQLKASIEWINELEKLFTPVDSPIDFYMGKDGSSSSTDPTTRNYLDHNLLEKKISQIELISEEMQFISRIQELWTISPKRVEELLKNHQYDRIIVDDMKNSITAAKTSPNNNKNNNEKKLVFRSNNTTSIEMPSSTSKRDSELQVPILDNILNESNRLLSSLFDRNRDDLAGNVYGGGEGHFDEKVRLRKAIKNIRENLLENSKLYKIHHLLRTKTIPGVFSDIYTCKLTDLEKRLKKLRYWDSRKDSLRYWNKSQLLDKKLSKKSENCPKNKEITTDNCTYNGGNDSNTVQVLPELANLSEKASKCPYDPTNMDEKVKFSNPFYDIC